MGTSNFYYKNRLIIVTNEDYEDGNIPEMGKYHPDSLRSFETRLLAEQPFVFFEIVYTLGYYQGACIDYWPADIAISEQINIPEEPAEAIQDIANFLSYKPATIKHFFF